MSNKQKREEIERATEGNPFSMASVVKMQISLNAIGGGDYLGDTDAVVAREQFVHGPGKADLGWCMGVHAVAMVARVSHSPEALQSFKIAVEHCVEENLDEFREQLEKIDEPKGEE